MPPFSPCVCVCLCVFSLIDFPLFNLEFSRALVPSPVGGEWAGRSV